MDAFNVRGRIKIWIILTLLLFGLFLFILRHSFSHEKPKAPAIRVLTSVVQRKTIPIFLPELGAVVPTDNVIVRTQINGQLLQVFFKEGQIVKQGELLAQIDPRLFEAQLMQYEGQLARDMALLANAKTDLKRYETLWKQDSIAQQTLETQKSVVKQYEGVVKLDEGLIQSTRVNLMYCQITSPINGRVGLRLVDPGNYVQTTDTAGLAVLTTLNPINVVFSIPEDNVPEVMKTITSGQTMLVEAYNRNQTKLLAVGKLLTIDNQIDPTTGTVKLKAIFDNKDYQLFPNQFVIAKLLVKTLVNVITVPTAAIQYNPQGSFVYVTSHDKAQIKSITLGIILGDTAVIKTGLSVGDEVVIEGADKLIDGAAVMVANAPASMRKVNK